MAEGKKSIVVYADWIKKFEALSDDEAGRLIKHFFRYVNDLEPIAPDRITEIAFIDIESCLKRDLVKWEIRAERSRQNGKKGGRPTDIENPEKPKETQQVILEPRKPDSVSVNDSVSVIPKGIKTNLSVNWEGLLSQFNEITGKKLKVVDDKAKRQFIARLKDGYTKNDIVSAITNCYNSEFHQSNGHKNLTLEFISRPDKFAMYFDFKETAPKPKKEDRL